MQTCCDAADNKKYYFDRPISLIVFSFLVPSCYPYLVCTFIKLLMGWYLSALVIGYLHARHCAQATIPTVRWDKSTNELWMRHVPLERNINIAVNGCSGFATSTREGLKGLISRSRGTYLTMRESLLLWILTLDISDMWHGWSPISLDLPCIGKGRNRRWRAQRTVRASLEMKHQTWSRRGTWVLDSVLQKIKQHSKSVQERNYHQCIHQDIDLKSSAPSGQLSGYHWGLPNPCSSIEHTQQVDVPGHFRRPEMKLT